MTYQEAIRRASRIADRTYRDFAIIRVGPGARDWIATMLTPSRWGCREWTSQFQHSRNDGSPWGAIHAYVHPAYRAEDKWFIPGRLAEWDGDRWVSSRRLL